MVFTGRVDTKSYYPIVVIYAVSVCECPTQRRVYECIQIDIPTIGIETEEAVAKALTIRSLGMSMTDTD